MKKIVSCLLCAMFLFFSGFAFADPIESFEDLKDGHQCRLTGKIFQIVENEGFLFELRGEKSINLVFVESETDSFFEGQKLIIEGAMTGTFSYNTRLHDTKTIPRITPEKIK